MPRYIWILDYNEYHDSGGGELGYYGTLARAEAALTKMLAGRQVERTVSEDGHCVQFDFPSKPGSYGYREPGYSIIRTVVE